MFPKVINDLSPKEVLNYMKKVFIGEESTQDFPVVFAESGTCYAFSAKSNPSKKNDWRADGYRWRHNGKTDLRAENTVIRRTYFNIYTAPKKSCTEFRRIAHECKDYPDIIIIYYSGDHTIAGRFPHGNRRSGITPYIRTCPSVIEACRNADGEPSTILQNLYNAQAESLEESMVSSPRDTSQIKNVKKYSRRKMKQALTVLDDMNPLSDEKFVFEIDPVANLMATAYQEERLEKINAVLGHLHISDSQYLSFRIVLHFQSFAVSSVAYKSSEDFPTVFLFYLIHDSETEVPHHVLWKIACERLPKLSLITNMPLHIGDDALDLEEAENPPAEIFSAVVNKMQKWKESPATAVWELQESASKLKDLAKYYEKRVRKHEKVSTKLNCAEIHILTDSEDIRWVKTSVGSPIVSPFHNSANGQEEIHDMSNTDNHNESLVTEMKKLFKLTDIKYISQSGSFLVVRENDVRIVKLFPKESCSCASSAMCVHIEACKFFLGQDLQEYNLSWLAEEDMIDDDDRALTHSKLRNCKKHKMHPQHSGKDKKLIVEIMTSRMI